MSTLVTTQLGSTAAAQPALVAPANVVDGPNGGVRVDPSVTPVAPAKVEAPAGDRPAWLPEGFKTPEDFATAYKELRTKMSQDGAPKEPVKPAEGTPAEAAAAAPTGEVAAKAVADAGLDMSALEAEYADKGVLSEDSLVKLEKAGLSRTQVDAYIKGQEARGAALRADFATIAGGEDRLQAVYEWAGSNMSADDLANYNGFIDAGNTEGAKLMLKGIVASYESVNGREPALITGNGGQRATAFAPYESNAQMVSDMAKPEYATDPAFRAKVMQRLSVSHKMLR